MHLHIKAGLCVGGWQKQILSDQSLAAGNASENSSENRDAEVRERREREIAREQ